MMSTIRCYIIIFCLGIYVPAIAQSEGKNQENVEASNDTIVLYNEWEFYNVDKDIENRNLFVKLDGKYVYYNRKKGKLQHEKSYKDILRIYVGLIQAPLGSYILYKEDGSYECIYFLKGKLKNFKKPIFNEHSSFLTIVLRDRKKGLLNKNMELVLPTEYDDIERMTKAKGKRIYKNDKVGFFYKKLVLEAKYDSITNYVFRSYHNDADVFVYPSLNGKMGVFDFESKEVLPFIYDEISPYFAAGFLNVDTEKPFLFVVKMGDKFGVVNSKNEILVPIEFDTAEVLDKKINEIYGIKD